MPKSKSYDQLRGDGLQLRILFDELGTNQRLFSDKIGISRNTLTNWINSEYISVENLMKVEKGLGMDIAHKFKKLQGFQRKEYRPYASQNNVQEVSGVYDGRQEQRKTITEVEFIEYKELKQKVPLLEEMLAMKKKEADENKDKYINLLEKHNDLLEQLKREVKRL